MDLSVDLKLAMTRIYWVPLIRMSTHEPVEKHCPEIDDAYDKRRLSVMATA